MMKKFATPYSAYEGKYFNDFALYGGGNATLITYMHNNTSELISVSARQHRPGLGWDDSASTFYLNEPFEPLGLLRNRHDLGTPRRIALIDKYGKATSFWSDYLNNNYFTTEFK